MSMNTDELMITKNFNYFIYLSNDFIKLNQLCP